MEMSQLSPISLDTYRPSCKIQVHKILFPSLVTSDGRFLCEDYFLLLKESPVLKLTTQTKFFLTFCPPIFGLSQFHFFSLYFLQLLLYQLQSRITGVEWNYFLVQPAGSQPNVLLKNSLPSSLPSFSQIPSTPCSVFLRIWSQFKSFRISLFRCLETGSVFSNLPNPSCQNHYPVVCHMKYLQKRKSQRNLR